MQRNLSFNKMAKSQYENVSRIIISHLKYMHKTVCEIYKN